MPKLILRKAKLLEFTGERGLLLEDLKSGEYIRATYSAQISNYPTFKIGEIYQLVVSPHDLLNGRIITSPKGYDLDYSYV